MYNYFESLWHVGISSSGHKVDNSLLLLGQYSDDELEEGSKKRVTSAVMESSSADHNDQVVYSLHSFCSLQL